MVVSPTVHISEKRNPQVEKMLNDLLKKSAIRSVMVGYWAGENKEADGADLVVVARAHEYGTRFIPQRSFLRSTVIENREKIDRFIEKQVMEVIDQRQTMLQAMKKCGAFVTAMVKRKIQKSKEWAVPLSPKTIKRKGSSHPLVDTGEMRNKVDYRIDA